MPPPPKTAIITGASRGIGAAIARHLAASGVAVVVNFFSGAAAARALCAEITAAGGQAAAFQADITSEAEVAALVNFGEQKFGGVNILVNNAGISPGNPLDGIDAAQIDAIFAVNVRGLLLASKNAARAFGDYGGAIVNIGSIWGANPAVNAAAYSASKAAVNAITLSLARELGPRGIRVNAVTPGLILTERCAAEVPEAALQQVAMQTPLRRLGLPEEVAELVTYLASDSARWVTGQIIAASGGAI
jgi:3-oxoacyl-[acyl-carrier protein] reductase